MVEVIDYRVSRVLILCKDCGQDVGLYPARHKCGSLSSETPPLPSIPKQYLSAGSPNSSNSSAQSKNNDHSSEGLWNKLRYVSNWKDSNAEDAQGSKLWDKLLSATAYYSNTDCDSDNESEKDEWEGETHISRILREYYENKGADLPDWLYGSDDKNSTNISTQSDSSTENNYRQQVNTNLNDTNNSKLHLVNNNVSRDRQPKIHDLRELTTSPTSVNGPSTLMDRSIDRSRDKSRDRNRNRSRDKGRDKSGDRSNPLPNSYNDQYRNNIVPTMPSSLPKNMDSIRYNDRSIKQPIDNTLPPRGRQPLPNVYSASDDNVRLMDQKSHQQLRTGSGGRLYNDTPHLPTNRSKSVSPNPPSFSSHPQKQQRQQPPIPRDLRGYNYNSNPYEGDGRGRQGVPPLGPHGSGRNNRPGRFF